MPVPITQINVYSQTLGTAGSESCGYHTLKNSIVIMLYFQGIINRKQLETMASDPILFEALFGKIAMVDRHGHADLQFTQFIDQLTRIKAGEYDFSHYGITKKQLAQLRLIPDDTQDITVAGYSLGVGAPGHGLSGMEEDLLVAAATVKLARTKGEAHHVFALALNNAHWVTAAVQQNAAGERTWFFMDSWNNQRYYKTSVINRIEAILTKSEAELETYLRTVYENSSDLLIRRYNFFFNLRTGAPIPGQRIDPVGNGHLFDAKAYFVEDKKTLEIFVRQIENRFRFMQSVGWLTTPHDKARQLYHLVSFIMDNLDATNAQDMLAKATLQPIYDELKVIYREEHSTKKAIVDVDMEVEEKIVLTAEEEKEEVQRINNNAYDVKKHFNLLLNTTLASKPIPDSVQVVDRLITADTLSEQLAMDYPGKDYVVLFYAHKPHSTAKSPFFPDESAAHTSVLLCKVKDGTIQHTLNVDGYNYLEYVDVLGERPGVPKNPHIQQRLVLQADATYGKTPLQRASWSNMNCVLYAFDYVEQILKLFDEQPELMNELFPSNKGEPISAESLFLLEEGILAGLVGKYVRKEGADYVYDDTLRKEHHRRLREDLAEQFSIQCSEQRNADVSLLEEETVVDTTVLEINDSAVSRLEEAASAGTAILEHDIGEGSSLEEQQEATLDAIKHHRPYATESFVAQFVKAIRWLIEGIVSAIEHIAQKIGLAF